MRLVYTYSATNYCGFTSSIFKVITGVDLVKKIDEATIAETTINTTAHRLKQPNTPTSLNSPSLPNPHPYPITIFTQLLLIASSLVAFFTAASLPVVGSLPIVGSGLVRRHDNTCNTGPVQCCQNVEDADGPMASQLLALLGVAVRDVNVPVGIQCNPIRGIGAGSASCEAEPVCCDDKNYQGLIALGCLPINVGL